MDYKISKINKIKPTIKNGLKYIYLNDSNMFLINDGSSEFSRLMTYYKNGFAIISASRHENSELYNKKYTEELEKYVAGIGLGYRKMLGGYPEEKQDGDTIQVEEISIAFPYDKNRMSEQDFFNIAINLCDKFEQDSVLICLPTLTDGYPTYFDRNGNKVMEFKSVRLSVPADEYYSKPNKAPKFTFDSIDYLNKKYFGKQMPSNISIKYKENFDVVTGCHLAKDTLPYEKEFAQYTKLIKDTIKQQGDVSKYEIAQLLNEPKNPHFNLKYYDSNNIFNKSKLIEDIVTQDKYLDFKDGKITLYNFPKEIYK